MTWYAASAAYIPQPHPPREAATLQERNYYRGMPVLQQDYQRWPVLQQDYQGKAYWVIIKMLVKYVALNTCIQLRLTLCICTVPLAHLLRELYFLENFLESVRSDGFTQFRVHCNTFSLWLYAAL